jgi:hypothetical protein
MPEVEATDRAGMAAALSGAILLLALLGGPLVSGGFYLYDDLYTFHLPLRVFYSDCLQAGDDFRWFPRYYGGFDLHGEGQIGLLHPMHLFLYRLLPLQVAYPTEFLLHYVLLLIGMHVFLRQWVASPAALLGSILFTFFGYNTYHFMHINSIAIVSHLPWSLWLIDRLFRAPSTSRGRCWAGFGLALLTGSELLHGYPQMVWFVKLAEGSYLVFLLAAGKRWRPVLTYAWYTFLGVLLGCAQLVPTWEALNRSERARLGRDRILHGSLHPLNLSQFLAPFLFQDRYVPETDGINDQPIRLWELGVYQGGLIVPLLVWLALQWPALRPGARRLARFSTGLVLLGLLLALGRYGPFAELLVRAPLVNSFRIPARYILLVHFGLAGLAAVAVEDLVRRRERPGRTGWLLLVPLASGVCCFAVWLGQRYGASGLPPLATPLRLLFNVPHMTVAAALVALAAYRPRLGLVAMVGFTVADAALYVFHLMLWEPGSVRTLQAALHDLPALPPVPAGYRLHFVTAQPGAVAPGKPAPCLPAQVSLAGYAMTGGYAALVPHRRLDYERPESQRLAGVAWVWYSRGGAWQPASDPLPRAQLVTRAITSDDPSRLADLDLKTTAVVAHGLGGLAGPPGRVVVVHDRPGYLVLAVDVPGRQLLVWNESYHPGGPSPATAGRRHSNESTSTSWAPWSSPAGTAWCSASGPGRSTAVSWRRPSAWYF